MKSNQMYMREFVEAFDLEGTETESIFMRMHKGKSKEQPIVSMGDDHLLNTIRLRLVKKVNEHLAELEDQMKVDLLRGYAPDDMDERTRVTLGLKKISAEKAQQVREKLAQVLETARSMLLNKSLELTMPYIVVAATREGTLLKLREILVEATGITGKVDLPEYVTHRTMTQEEVLELTGGNPLEGYMEQDWDVGGMDFGSGPLDDIAFGEQQG